MAAHQNRLQVTLQQEMHRGRLSNLAPTQPSKTNHAFQTHLYVLFTHVDGITMNEPHLNSLWCLLCPQGEPCVMGQKQIYMKRRPGNYCMLGKDYSKILSAESCICRAHDFEW